MLYRIARFAPLLFTLALARADEGLWIRTAGSHGEHRRPFRRLRHGDRTLLTNHLSGGQTLLQELGLQ